MYSVSQKISDIFSQTVRNF